MYTILTKNHLDTPTVIHKWNNKFESITDNEWSTIYKMPFMISKDHNCNLYNGSKAGLIISSWAPIPF